MQATAGRPLARRCAVALRPSSSTKFLTVELLVKVTASTALASSAAVSPTTSASAGGTAYGGELAQVAPRGREAREERLDAVGAGEHDPVVAARRGDRPLERSGIGRRCDRDGGERDHLRPLGLQQVRERARLRARAGYDEAPAEELALLEPRDPIT